MERLPMKAYRFAHGFAVVLSTALLASCGGSQSTAPQLPAAPSQSSSVRVGGGDHIRYHLVDLGTFGGPNSTICSFTPVCLPSQVLNDRGTLVGAADTSIPDPFPAFCFDGLIRLPDCYTTRAFATRNRELVRLSALSKGSAVAVSVSNNDLIAGVAQNGKTDPIVPGFPEVRAALWDGDKVGDLGTFGGGETNANDVNDRGQVAGATTNTIPDPYSFIYNFLGTSNGTQTRGYLWQNGSKRDLGTLGGPDAFAVDVNERGQVAGWSYVNSTPNQGTGLPTYHPFLWQKGKMRDLGTLGGTQVYNIEGLNDRGEVLGLMTLAGEQRAHPFLWNGRRLVDLGTFGGPGGDGAWINDRGEAVGWGGTTQNCPNLEGGGQHSFLWRNGVKRDLGSVPGTDNGDASWINSKSQIVGSDFSCDATVFDAYLWEKGSIVDLNTLIPAGSPLHLFIALAINDRGEIAGLGSLPNGDIHAVLLIPRAGETRAAAAETSRSIAGSHTLTNRQLTTAELIAIKGILAGRHRRFMGLRH